MVLTIEGAVTSASSMQRLGAALAGACQRADIVFLTGCLGAGKTTLAQGFMKHLGVMDGVKSPTYALVETYDCELGCVHHFDCYRMHHAQELIDMGIDDFLDDSAICLFEWPEKGAGVLPNPTVQVKLSVVDSDTRYATLCFFDVETEERFLAVKELMKW